MGGRGEREGEGGEKKLFLMSTLREMEEGEVDTYYILTS